MQVLPTALKPVTELETWVKIPDLDSQAQLCEEYEFLLDMLISTVYAYQDKESYDEIKEHYRLDTTLEMLRRRCKHWLETNPDRTEWHEAYKSIRKDWQDHETPEPGNDDRRSDGRDP